MWIRGLSMQPLRSSGGAQRALSVFQNLQARAPPMLILHRSSGAKSSLVCIAGLYIIFAFEEPGRVVFDVATDSRIDLKELLRSVVVAPEAYVFF